MFRAGIIRRCVIWWEIPVKYSKSLWLCMDWFSYFQPSPRQESTNILDYFFYQLSCTLYFQHLSVTFVVQSSRTIPIWTNIWSHTMRAESCSSVTLKAVRGLSCIEKIWNSIYEHFTMERNFGKIERERKWWWLETKW